jgi:lambda repressor-like predicted transcriptional regulator/antitoxin component of MazEF toxin-antitoxin module
MKLQKQKAYKSKGKEYFKWVLIIPPDRVNQLGWKEGTELNDEIKGNNLLISPIFNSSLKKNKEEILYEEFRDSIKNLLQRHPSGLTWTQIRDKLSLPQKVPNNIWVNRMKKDIGLEQIKIDGDLLWNFEYDSVYTIGYEGYDLDKFIRKLKDSNIQQVIDVREIALSRKNGFSKSALKTELNKQGIRYEHLEKLGSPKDIRHKLKDSKMTPEDYKIFFEEYKKHIYDQDVMQNISVIEGLAKRKKSVIMCFERNFTTCHRSIIAEELKRRGWKVSHL